MDIVKKIDDIRVKRGWSFYKLAQESGLSQQTFTQWMNKKSTPTISALTAVCDAFGITFSDFFAETNNDATPETKKIIENWNYLSQDEKRSINLIIDNYIKNKQ